MLYRQTPGQKNEIKFNKEVTTKNNMTQQTSKKDSNPDNSAFSSIEVDFSPNKDIIKKGKCK